MPADRQVIVSEQGGERSCPRLLLSGGEILAQLRGRARAESDGPARAPAARPAHRDPEVAAPSWTWTPTARIRAIEIMDAQGNRSRFDFDDVRENVGLKDTLFHFEDPAGVEVIAG